MVIRLAQTQSALGQLLFDTGRWDDAMVEVEALYENLKEPAAACNDLSIAAVICFHRGELTAARRHLAAAVRHTRRMGNRVIGPLALARSLDCEQDDELPEALAVLTADFTDHTEELEETEGLLPDAVRLAVKIGHRSTAEFGASPTRKATVALADGTRASGGSAGRGLWQRRPGLGSSLGYLLRHR